MCMHSVPEERRIKIERDRVAAGKYNILSTIKNDNRGKVYVAEHSAIGIKRIIKEVSVHSVYKDVLAKEAYILGRLNYRYIPLICDVEENESSFYIIEEYIEGNNLYDYIRKNGVFGMEAAISYGIKLAEIVEFLHSGNSFKVCHLDIQPKNIMINNNDIYLVDFGNSKSSREPEAAGYVMATKGFAPPEQYNRDFGKDMESGCKADIYGLGAVLLYMLTGRDAGNSGDAVQILCNQGVSEGLAKIISDAVSKNPGCRQGSAAILKKNLIDLYCDKQVENKKPSGTPYIISVAGIKHGSGTTYVSLALLNGLRQMGVNASYEENNPSNAVREFARYDASVAYDRGYFVFRGYRLKPMYGENVRISCNEEVIVRDEGIFSHKKKYADAMALVINADILHKGLADKVLSFAEKFRQEGIRVIIILNMCSENDFKRLSLKVPALCGYISPGSSPFCWQKNETSEALEIINHIYKREKDNVKNKKRERLSFSKRIKDYCHNLR